MLIDDTSAAANSISCMSESLNAVHVTHLKALALYAESP